MADKPKEDQKTKAEPKEEMGKADKGKKDKKSPLKDEGEDFRYLVMPIRLNV